MLEQCYKYEILRHCKVSFFIERKLSQKCLFVAKQRKKTVSEPVFA